MPGSTQCHLPGSPAPGVPEPDSHLSQALSVSVSPASFQATHLESSRTQCLQSTCLPSVPCSYALGLAPRQLSPGILQSLLEVSKPQCSTSAVSSLLHRTSRIVNLSSVSLLPCLRPFVVPQGPQDKARAPWPGDQCPVLTSPAPAQIALPAQAGFAPGGHLPPLQPPPPEEPLGCHLPGGSPPPRPRLYTCHEQLLP